MTPRVVAVEDIRRMRGGAQARLMRASDGKFYVVKFQNNPQGKRVLANALLGALLAKELGLPIPEVAIVEVRPDLVRYSPEMVIELQKGRLQCQPGLCFGSRATMPGDTGLLRDWLSDEQLRAVENLAEFAGMLVFDKWTGNMDTRQVVFARSNTGSAAWSYRALMIDQGFCFNGQCWDFPDLPKCGLCQRSIVYGQVSGMNSFEATLARLDGRVSQTILDQIAGEIPRDWYDSDVASLNRLLAELDQRRRFVPELLRRTVASARGFFPAWRSDEAGTLESQSVRVPARGAASAPSAPSIKAGARKRTASA